MWVASPDGFRFVQLLLLDLALLDFLSLWLLFLFLLILIVYLLDLSFLFLVFFLILGLLGLLVLFIWYILLGLFQDVQVDGVGDEFRVLLDDFLDFTLIKVVCLLISL